MNESKHFQDYRTYLTNSGSLMFDKFYPQHKFMTFVCMSIDLLLFILIVSLLLVVVVCCDTFTGEEKMNECFKAFPEQT